MKRLGEALRAAVSDEVPTAEGRAARSALMNANRRRVFEHVAWHPCATVGEVARALAVSDPTAAWHLDKLVDAGYVEATEGARPRAYVAAGLGLGREDVARFGALAGPDGPRVLGLVIRTPGLTGSELAARVRRGSVRGPLGDLLKVGLVVSVVDGRYRRYYPGGAVTALERAAPKRLRDFRRHLVRRLAHDRLAPVVRAAPGDVLEVDVSFGEERATLRLPAASLLAGRLQQADLS